MKLFDEMEKCFPETEKHWNEMIEALGDLYLTPHVLRAAESILGEWVMERYLHPDGKLHALFVQAGIENEMNMATLIVRWMHRMRHSEGRPYINQTNTSPAQE